MDFKLSEEHMNLIEQDIDDNGILSLRLNRPEKLNVLSQETLEALNQIFNVIKENKKVKALLLTGTGRAFCAGADISQLATCDAQSGYQFACQGHSVFRMLETLGKPSLTAINGFAFGGGCELAISTSLRIAATTAQFSQPEVKLGIIPGYGGTQRLARLIGKGRAMDLCLTGRSINAETALQWGLVTEVVESQLLIKRGKEILNGILAMAPLAIASVMDVIDRGYDLPLSDALHLEALHFAKACASEDKQEGVTAFLAKRQAKFKGD